MQVTAASRWRQTLVEAHALCESGLAAEETCRQQGRAYALRLAARPHLTIPARRRLQRGQLRGGRQAGVQRGRHQAQAVLFGAAAPAAARLLLQQPHRRLALVLACASPLSVLDTKAA